MKMSPVQRLISYVSTFDEGFGVTYEELWHEKSIINVYNDSFNTIIIQSR
jgi:hypothetical protein